MRFRQPVVDSGEGAEVTSSLMRSAGGSASALAVLSSPADLLSSVNADPIAQWLAPVLQETLQSLGSEGASAVVGFDRGPLLWMQEEEGWLLGTVSGQPDEAAVDADLQQRVLFSRHCPLMAKHCRSGPV